MNACITNRIVRGAGIKRGLINSASKFLGAAAIIALSTWAPSSIAGPITIDASSNIQSGSYVYVYWGHENTSTALIADPGSAGVSSQHGPFGSGHQLSSSYYAVTDPTANEVDFSFGMSNSIDLGGYAVSRARYKFSLTGATDYDLSGNYASSSNVNGNFLVALKNLDTNTTFYTQNLLGALTGAGLTGTLGAGNYELDVDAWIQANGTQAWLPWGPDGIYGAIAGGTGYGTGAIQFDLVAADVPEPGTLALLGLSLAGLGALRRRRR